MFNNYSIICIGTHFTRKDTRFIDRLLLIDVVAVSDSAFSCLLVESSMPNMLMQLLKFCKIFCN